MAGSFRESYLKLSRSERNLISYLALERWINKNIVSVKPSDNFKLFLGNIDSSDSPDLSALLSKIDKDAGKDVNAFASDLIEQGLIEFYSDNRGTKSHDIIGLFSASLLYISDTGKLQKKDVEDIIKKNALANYKRENSPELLKSIVSEMDSFNSIMSSDAHKFNTSLIQKELEILEGGKSTTTTPSTSRGDMVPRRDLIECRKERDTAIKNLEDYRKKVDKMFTVMGENDDMPPELLEELEKIDTSATFTSKTPSKISSSSTPLTDTIIFTHAPILNVNNWLK